MTPGEDQPMHTFVGDRAEPGDRVSGAWVCVWIEADGRESVYGQEIRGHMLNFAIGDGGIGRDLKDKLTNLLRQQGTPGLAAREGARIEWRLYTGEEPSEIEVLA